METSGHNIPEDLLKALDAANEHFSEAKRHLEAAVQASEYDHQEHINRKTEEVRAAERELEKITREIQAVIQPDAQIDTTKRGPEAPGPEET